MDIGKSREKVLNGISLFDDRRPDLYAEILTNTYMWNPLDFFGLYGEATLPPGKKSKIAVAQINSTSTIFCQFDSNEFCGIFQYNLLIIRKKISERLKRDWLKRNKMAQS